MWETLGEMFYNIVPSMYCTCDYDLGPIVGKSMLLILFKKSEIEAVTMRQWEHKSKNAEATKWIFLRK